MNWFGPSGDCGCCGFTCPDPIGLCQYVDSNFLVHSVPDVSVIVTGVVDNADNCADCTNQNDSFQIACDETGLAYRLYDAGSCFPETGVVIRREVIAFWSANAGFGQLALNIIARSNISDGLGLYIGVSSIERTVLFAIVDCEGNPFQ